ncbi:MULTISPECIES: hypothetical protein [unclassified Nocardia]|uniref:hypothetical protein n=1 Tax=unclassified Nocardia TaxID=2637762 RepID=UPI001CE3EACA|nr:MULTISPECIES: hypothetical protein [unclassified Nocardia]
MNAADHQIRALANELFELLDPEVPEWGLPGIAEAASNAFGTGTPPVKRQTMATLADALHRAAQLAAALKDVL